MSDMAVKTLTREATALTYEEQLELLYSLNNLVQKGELKRRKNLDFDSYVIPCERANFADQYIEELRKNDRV